MCSEYSDIQIYLKIYSQIYSFAQTFVDFVKANIFGYSFDTFFPHEYIRTFIRTVRVQRIYLIVFAQQNNSCFVTNGTHFHLFL